jgi:hypothetical protein
VADHLPAGTFRFAAKCLDDAGAESQVDGGNFRVRRFPGRRRTSIQHVDDARQEIDVLSRFHGREGHQFHRQQAGYRPYRSWVTFYYYGHDDRRDTKLCSLADPDECIDFNIKVLRKSERLGQPGSEDSGWLPRSGVHDSDPNSTADSNSVNIASYEYDLESSAVDENGARDGTPTSVHIIGNYDPVMGHLRPPGSVWCSRQHGRGGYRHVELL